MKKSFLAKHPELAVHRDNLAFHSLKGQTSQPSQAYKDNYKSTCTQLEADEWISSNQRSQCRESEEFQRRFSQFSMDSVTIQLSSRSKPQLGFCLRPYASQSPPSQPFKSQEISWTFAKPGRHDSRSTVGVSCAFSQPNLPSQVSKPSVRRRSDYIVRLTPLWLDRKWRSNPDSLEKLAKDMDSMSEILRIVEKTKLSDKNERKQFHEEMRAGCDEMAKKQNEMEAVMGATTAMLGKAIEKLETMKTSSEEIRSERIMKEKMERRRERIGRIKRNGEEIVGRLEACVEATREAEKERKAVREQLWKIGAFFKD